MVYTTVSFEASLQFSFVGFSKCMYFVYFALQKGGKDRDRIAAGKALFETGH